MSKSTLKAAVRQVVGRRVKQLRRSGWMPGNVFGKDIKSANIQIEEKSLAHLLKQAGGSTLVYLQIEGEKADRPVMISELKRDPVTGEILHVSWHQVNLKEKITSAIPIRPIGVAPAEEQHLGILVQQLHAVELEALPADMPENVEVDISPLAAVNDAIHVKDIKIDDKLTLRSDPEAIVVKIEPLAAEEPKEVPVPVESGAVAEGEAVPTEGEKPAEGEIRAPSATGE